MSGERISQIEEVLLRDLDRQRERHAQANRHFQSSARDVPTHLPGPDGVAHIENIASIRKTVYAEYKRALDRYNDFVIRGIIPKEFAED